MLPWATSSAAAAGPEVLEARCRHVDAFQRVHCARRCSNLGPQGVVVCAVLCHKPACGGNSAVAKRYAGCDDKEKQRGLAPCQGGYLIGVGKDCEVDCNL
jgi:hypothetical protein